MKASRRDGRELLRGLGQRLEVALDDGVNEHAGVVGGVARRHVHDHSGGLRRGGGRVDGGDGEVVVEPVLAADDYGRSPPPSFFCRRPPLLPLLVCAVEFPCGGGGDGEGADGVEAREGPRPPRDTVPL
jgi:hypothetical protein